MTTLENRPNTALLVVDVQNGVVEGAHERDVVVANIASLVGKARREGVPVVWVQHSSEELVPGSDTWQIVPELTPGEAEPLVEKNYGDSFEATSLETVLSDLGVGWLVVAGAETDACIRSTLHGAFTRGYDATLVSDAHTTGDRTQWGAPPPDQVIAHTNLYWTYETAPGRTAGTAETKNVGFGSPASAQLHSWLQLHSGHSRTRAAGTGAGRHHARAISRSLAHRIPRGPETGQEATLAENALTTRCQFRDARVASGMSQRELSERSGVRQADISRIERGTGNPTEATLQRLASALAKRVELV